MVRMQSTSGVWQRYGLASAMAVFIAIRIVVLIAAYTAPVDPDRLDAKWSSHVPTVRWDGGHYWYILRNGYPPGPPTSDVVAFFPGYPLAAWPLTVFMSADAALVVLTHVASALAMVFLYLWSGRRYGPKAAFWSVLLLSAYPAAFFFSTAYADGLLLLCVTVALWLLDRERIWMAAVVAGLGTLVRPTGLALAGVAWLWALLREPRRRWPRRLPYLVGLGLTCVSGLIGFQLYLWYHYQRPDAFFAVQSNWGSPQSVGNPIERILTLKPVLQPAFRPIKYALRGEFARLVEVDPDTGEYRVWNPLLNLIVLITAIVGLARPGRIPRITFLLPILVFLEAYLPDPYRGDRLVGIARYQLIAVPCVLLLAEWISRRWPRSAAYGMVAALVALQCVYIRHFVNWVMVG